MLFVTLIVFFAIFTQAASGFGLALVSMPLLVTFLDIRTATPLIAIVGGTAELFLLLRYRHALNFRAVVRLSLAALIGIPLGVYALDVVNAQVITAVLGVIVVLYSLYALLRFRLPTLRNNGWAYGLGFISGILGGAFNTSGPPVIIYGTCRSWQPAEFKSNLQAFFLFNSIITFVSHAGSGNFTPVVWQYYLWALPGIFLGMFFGVRLDGRLNPDQFRKVVLILLLILGVRLLFIS
ncbi:MAG: sulfite exporter TauE/SafE family protein [Anaerolineales bacterium]|nr:sulfite exporter TauE/SafE family protein [Anaerolineales bacterium]